MKSIFSDKDSEQGQIMMVDKDIINIDYSYQRNQRKSKVEQMSRAWSWPKCGAIKLCRRPDGSLWVFDGGHRLAAAKMVDSITQLPCVVFSMDEIADEAKAFLGSNRDIARTKAYEIFHAAIAANLPSAKVIYDLISETGYNISSSAAGGGHGSGKTCNAIGTLYKMIDRDATLAKKTFLACAKIANGKRISVSLLSGLFALAWNQRTKVDVLAETMISRLAKLGPEYIEIEFANAAKLAGKGGETLCAKVLLKLINKRRQQKNCLVWNEKLSQLMEDAKKANKNRGRKQMDLVTTATDTMNSQQ